MAGLFVPFNPKGRPPKYSPQELLEEFEKYIAEREANPIIVETVVEGGTTNQAAYGKKRDLKKMHPLSIADFCIFLGCSRNWWNSLGKNNEDFLGVKDRIENYLQTYQMKGAYVGMFNANIVSRQLGLVDKQEITENVVYQMQDPNE